MLNLLAPAKLNLTLEVLSRRPDGFHEICSIVQTISLADDFCFQPAEGIEFRCNQADWVAAESLVSTAVGLLQDIAGNSRGAIIEIDKHIPLVSGLGGDSSDAATVLRGLNWLWELKLSPEELYRLAAQLGSDVAFFLHGGTALIEGRGELVTPLPPLPHRWVVLVMPAVPRITGKTKQLYSSLQTVHYTDGWITQRLGEKLKAGNALTASFLYNAFENVAFSNYAGLSSIWEQVARAGADSIHLAGSGPAIFTLLNNRDRAQELHCWFQEEGRQSYLAETIDGLGDK